MKLFFLVLLITANAFAMNVGDEFILKKDIEANGGWMRKNQTVVLVDKSEKMGKYTFALREDPRVIFWKTDMFTKVIDPAWVSENLKGK